MKLLVVFAALVAVCVGGAIPLVSQDSSNHVDDESQMLAANLEEPVDDFAAGARNGAQNQYWLFTRQNQNNRQVLTHNNINSVRNSNYRGNRGLVVIVHGWRNSGTSPMNGAITSAFLAVQDVNVIVVDWHRLANGRYDPAAQGVPNIGHHLGDFLVWLIRHNGGNWNNVHLVGFSLGAHVVGNAGRRIRSAGFTPSRVTGLDPARPDFEGSSNRLNTNAGRYVEAIHTDGRVSGIMERSGHADFYPNGGRHPQPGCGALGVACSHGRSHEFFASSVRQSNRFTGRRCNNLREAELSTCTGANLHMGNGIFNKNGDVIMRTSREWNELPAEVFPQQYNLGLFQKRVNYHLLGRHIP